MYNADLYVQILIYTCSLPTFDHGLFLDFSVMPTNFEEILYEELRYM